MTVPGARWFQAFLAPALHPRPVRHLTHRFHFVALALALLTVAVGYFLSAAQLGIGGITLAFATAAEVLASRRLSGTGAQLMPATACAAVVSLAVAPSVLLAVQRELVPVWALLLVVPRVLSHQREHRLLPSLLACAALVATGAIWWHLASRPPLESHDGLLGLYFAGAMTVILGLLIGALGDSVSDVYQWEQEASSAASNATSSYRMVSAERATVAALVESQPLALIALDALGHVTFMNSAAEALTSRPFSQIHFQPISEVVLLETATASTLDQIWRRVLQTGETFDETADLLIPPRYERVTVAATVAAFPGRPSSQQSVLRTSTAGPPRSSPPVYGAIVTLRPLTSNVTERDREWYTERIDTIHQMACILSDSLVPMVRGAFDSSSNLPPVCPDAQRVCTTLVRRRRASDLRQRRQGDSPLFPRAFSPSQLLRDLTHRLSMERPHHVAAAFDSEEPNLPDAFADVDSIRDALLELASVAHDTASVNGSLMISAETAVITDGMRGFLVGTLERGGYVRFDIRDTACPFSLEELLHRFAPLQVDARDEVLAAFRLVDAITPSGETAASWSSEMIEEQTASSLYTFQSLLALPLSPIDGSPANGCVLRPLRIAIFEACLVTSAVRQKSEGRSEPSTQSRCCSL